MNVRLQQTVKRSNSIRLVWLKAKGFAAESLPMFLTQQIFCCVGLSTNTAAALSECIYTWHFTVLKYTAAVTTLRRDQAFKWHVNVYKVQPVKKRKYEQFNHPVTTVLRQCAFKQQQKARLTTCNMLETLSHVASLMLSPPSTIPWYPWEEKQIWWVFTGPFTTKNLNSI